MLIKQIRLLNEQIKEIEGKLEERVEQSPYSNLSTMPGLSFKLAATFISRNP